jgi:DnaJ-class molecular chaperone
MWYRLATIVNDEQLMSELTINATTPEDIKSNYKMLARKYHPDVNQDSDSTENFKNLTKVYEKVKDQPVMFKLQQTGEKKTTAEEVEDYMEDTNTEEEIKNALG